MGLIDVRRPAKFEPRTAHLLTRTVGDVTPSATHFATRDALICCLAAFVLSAACSEAPPVEAFDGGRVERGDGGAPSGLHAMGGTIVDGSGNAVTFRGVNRSGTEYECVQGRGIFDGPNDAASIDAIAAWNANAIRIPLNEDCWLGINGVPAAYAGAAYQQAISSYVQLVLSKGFTPILELHWSAPGDTAATGQSPMPDEDHSPDFWTSVAGAYGKDTRVILELFNEPYPDGNQDTVAAWTCWQQGGTCAGIAYAVAGMQELVTAVRGAGAANLILLGGVQYANSLSRWETYVPEDPQANLGAAWHLYNFNGCNSGGCFSSDSAPVLAAHPIVATEIGESDCGHGFIDAAMAWLDGRTSGYLAWTWDAWGGCGDDLISDYSGAPTAYGVGYRNHLLEL